MAPLLDTFGRVHTSLRISVTDRCNIRCFYCMPNEGVVFKQRAEILSFEEIVRFVPGMDPRIRKLLEEGRVTWARAKVVCRRILEAKPGSEKQVADEAVRELEAGPVKVAPRKALSVKSATKRLAKVVEKDGKATFTIDMRDLYSLFLVLDGKGHHDGHLDRVRSRFPGLIDG